MEGILFYWFCWIGWVILTFIYPKKHPLRLPLAVWLLAAMVFANCSLTFFALEWNGTGLFIIVTIYLYIARLHWKQILYFLLTAFILMLVTVCFLFFELYDPVWIIIDRNWLLAGFAVYVVLLLHSDHFVRLLALLFGMVHGEIFYAFILKQFSFSYPVSSLVFLDALALACFMVVLWNGLEVLTAYFNKYLLTVEKEKHKYHE